MTSKLQKPPDVLALRCRVPKLKKRLGRCYELSYLGVLADDDWTLVHGALKGPESLGGWVSHAWLLRESDQMVFDPAQDILLPKFEYQLKHRQRVDAEYSKFQAMAFAVHFGHYGPWHPLVAQAEIKRLLKEAAHLEQRAEAQKSQPSTVRAFYGQMGKAGFLRLYGPAALAVAEEKRLGRKI